MIAVHLLVFDGVDLLDVGGPYEVFLTADRLSQRRGDGPRFAVTLAGPDTRPVTAYGGMVITPAVAASEVATTDVAVIPGAIDIASVVADEAIVAAAGSLAAAATTATSVCTGAFVLGRLGMLNGRPWTTHFEDVDDLARQIDSDDGHAWVRWVDTGDVVTAGGLSSGIAMALHMVDRLAGRDLAVACARQIEYDWDPEGGVRTGAAG